MANKRWFKIFTHVKLNGEVVLWQVSRRFRPYILIVFNNLPQIGQAGSGIIILYGNGGALAKNMRKGASGLPVVHVFVLHDDIAILMKNNFKA